MFILLGCVSKQHEPQHTDTDTETTQVKDTEDTEHDAPNDSSGQTTASEETDEPQTTNESESQDATLGDLSDPTRLRGFDAESQSAYFQPDGCSVSIDDHGVLHLNANWDQTDSHGVPYEVFARVTLQYMQMLRDAGHTYRSLPNGSRYEGDKCTVLTFEIKAASIDPSQIFLTYGMGKNPVYDTMIYPTVTPAGTGDTEYLVFDMSAREDFASASIHSFILTWRDDVSTAENINSYIDIYAINLYADMEAARDDLGFELPAEEKPVTPTILPSSPAIDSGEDNEELGDVIATDPTDAWDITIEYPCQDGSVLYTYATKTAEDFDSVYRYHRQQGYQVYHKAERDGNLFATLTQGSRMVHIYWYKNTGELNVVVSPTAADALPIKNPSVTTGSYRTGITQITQPEYVNGMGFVIQLADGSFIVYDGGYPGQAERIYRHMKNSVPAGENIVIRAWVLTHSHSDHFSAFRLFASRYADKVTLEHIIVSPVDPSFKDGLRTDVGFFTNGELFDEVNKFEGVKLTYAHTGMEFTFCNLKMEILYTAEDLYKTSNPPGNFNSSSILSRLYDADGFSVMMTGDSGYEVGVHLRNIYSDEYLHSDVIQFAHHAGGGLKKSFYDAVRASVILYPCSYPHYVGYASSKELRIYLETADFVKAIYIAGVRQYTVYWGEDVPEGTLRLPVHVER